MGDIRERRRFDADWRFRRHDPEDHNDATAHLTYSRLRMWMMPTGNDLVDAALGHAPQRPSGEPVLRVPFTEPKHNDREWRTLDLPHDWGIEGPFDQKLSGRTGKLPWIGVGWYRKHFELQRSDIANRRVELEFDGSMGHTAVWLNGRCIGGWVYGYSSWRVNLTNHLAADGHNVLAVRVENLPDSSRWYPGAGLYRHVWLHLVPQVRFATWGAYVTTPKVTADHAWIDIDLVVETDSAQTQQVVLETTLYPLDSDGHPSTTPAAEPVIAKVRLDPLDAREAHRRHTIVVPEPRLWDVTEPHRYVAVSRLLIDGVIIDELTTPFGIRTFRFTAEDGFHLNGRRVPIQGVCQHHDLGALGAAVNTRAMERQLEILREMGCNAIRTAHNPPAPELLDLCDRLGFLVMDEAFDCWRIGKRRNDYAQYFDDWYEKDLRAMVRRDRNHPSVILWSIGNEILEQDLSDGWKLAAHLSAIVRAEDHSRPTTVGCNREHSAHTGFQSAVDVIGFNYKPWAYADLGKVHPLVPTYGSETSSCVSSRGIYVFPVDDDKSEGRENFQVTSYDLAAPPWAWAPDQEFAGLDDAPHTAGEFVWTGFDYLGEPTPYNVDRSVLLNFDDPIAQAKLAAQMKALQAQTVPSRSSYFGIVDLAGFPKDRYYLYQARWRPELPMAHLLPHWNWPDRVGELTPVHLYTSGDTAELFLNGRSLGKHTRGPREYRLRWDDVVYEPGELRAVVTRNGQAWIEAVRTTTGSAVALQVRANRPTLTADGDDLAFVTVEVVDADGRTVPNSSPEIVFSVEGVGRLIAVDNGDATSHVSFQSPRLPAFNGLALAIVGTRAGSVGRMALTVSSPGLRPASLQLDTVAAPG